MNPLYLLLLLAVQAFATDPIPRPDVGANVGTGTGQVYKDKIGNVLELKTLKAGTNIGLTNNASDITITSTSIAGPLSSSVGNFPVFGDTLGATLLDSGIASASLFKKDGSITATGAFNLGNFKIGFLATPTLSGDAATKGYVDSLVPTTGSLTSGTTGVTVTGGTNAVIGSGTSLAIQTATTSQPGLLSAADWAAFKAKLDAEADPLAIKKDGSATVSADIPFNSHKLTGVATPTLSGDAATKGYVDSATPASSNLTSGTTGVTVTGGTGAVLGSGTSFTIQSATTSQPGLLTGADWTTFNAKQSALTLGNLTSPTTGVSVAGGTGAVVGSGAALSIQNATTSQPGLLTAADWTTFNNKLGSYTETDPLAIKKDGSATVSANIPFAGFKLTGIGTPTVGTDAATKAYVDAATPASSNFTSSTTGVTVTGGTGAVLGSGTSLTIQSATTSQPGLLTAADWTAFNNKLDSYTLPFPTATVIGGVLSKAAVTHNFLTSISSIDGGVGQAQPACADLSNGAASCSTDTTNASNISSGTLAATRVATLNQNTTGSAGSFTGSLVGDVTGTQGATAIGPTTVTGKLITGYVSGAGTVAATDSLLGAIQKLNGNAVALSGGAITSLTGDIVASGPGAAAATLATVATPGTSPKVTFNAKGLITSGAALASGDIPNNAANTSGSSASFTGSLVGDVTGTQGVTAISASTVTGKLLAGYVSGAGTVAATDSVLAAFDKVTGNIALLAPLASPTFTGTVTAPTFSGALTGTASGNTAYSANQYGAVVSGSGNTMSVVAPDASTTKVFTSGGVAANPTWSVIPVLNQNTTGTAGGLTGTALTGDVSNSGNAVTIAAGAVTLTKQANLAANSIQGNNTASPTAPIALTSAQVNTLLGTTNPLTTLGDSVYGGAAGVQTRLAGSTSATKQFFTQTGNGTISAAPGWGAIASGDVPVLNQNTTGSAGSFTGSLVGDVTGTQGATAISSPTVTGKVLTGYVSGAGTVAATDSILQGIQKLNGNAAALNAITSLTGDGTASGPGASALTLATVATPGTSPKVTYNAKGLVTSGAALASGDIPNNAANTTGTSGGLSGAALTGDVTNSGNATTLAATSNTTLTSLANLTTVGAIGTGTWNGTTVATNHGGTGVTSVTTTPAATAFAGWDSNKNLFANNMVESYATTVTGASTDTLVVGSAYQQYFTGSTALQVVALPVASTLVLGQQYQIINNASVSITVQSSGANVIQVMAANTQLAVTCILTSGTSAASWSSAYSLEAPGTVTSVAMTVPSFLSVSGSPVTGSGTLGVTLSGTALPVANGGTALTSGVSGGILGYTATGTLASSAALPASQVVLGGGAGATPTGLAAGSQYQSLVMGASNPGYGQVNFGQSAAVTGTMLAAQAPALTGDVTSSAGSLATTVAAGAVTLAKQANFAANSIQGNNTGSPAVPLALTASQVNTLLGTTPNQLTTLGDIEYENATPTPARLAGNVTGTKKFLSQTGTGTVSAAPAWGQPACADLSNGAASCSTDTTNAANISSGTLGAGRLPLPAVAALGGVFSKAATSHNFLTSISSVDGSVGQAQPAFTDVSGSVAAGQMPALTGDVTTSAGAVATTLATVATPGTSPKITFNAKGLVTSGAALASGDIPNNAANTTGTSGGLTGTSFTGDVTNSGNATTLAATSNTTLTSLANLVTVGAIGTGTWNATTVATNHGGTGVTAVTTAPVASAWAGWNANKNFTANNLIESYATTVTSASTTTLTVSSAYQQYFTGTLTHTIVLPVASTLAAGQSFLLGNSGSGLITVQSSGLNTVFYVYPLSQMIVTCIVASGTDATSWYYAFIPAAPSFSYTSGTLIASQMVALTGDVTTSTGSAATSLVATTNSTLTSLPNLNRVGKNCITYSNFENNATTGWSLAHSALTSFFPSTVGTAGTAFSSAGGAGGGSAASGSLSLTPFNGVNALAGTYSMEYGTAAASTVGDMMISQAYTIDKEDKAKVMTGKFYYAIPSHAANISLPGTSSNSFGIAIYDVANAAWIMPAGVWGMTQTSGVGYVTFTFQTSSNMTSFQLAIFNANATGTSAGASSFIDVDDFSVGPQTAPLGAAITDWQSYPMVITGASSNPTKGSFSMDSAYWRRVGDSLEMRYDYEQSTLGAGAAGSGGYLFSLPAGLSIDTTKTTNPNGSSIVVGPMYAYNGTAEYTGSSVIYNTTHLACIEFPTISTSGFIGSGNVSLGNAVVRLHFTARVPIVGWSSNVQMSADTDTRVVAATYIASSNTTIAGATTAAVDFLSKQVDTHAAVNNVAGSWKFTAPVSGNYRVSTSVAFGAAESWTSGGHLALGLYKNTVQIISFDEISIPATTPGRLGNLRGSYTIALNAGDSIDVRATNPEATARTATWNSMINNETWISVERLSGPAVIAATETVSEKYSTTAGQSIANASTPIIVFGTKEADDHGAFNAATGVFTAPVSGTYAVQAWTTYQSGSFTQATVVRVDLYKNGVFNVDLAWFGVPFTGTQYIGLGGSTITHVNAGDTLDIRTYHQESTARTLQTGAGTNHESIYRIGN